MPKQRLPASADPIGCYNAHQTGIGTPLHAANAGSHLERRTEDSFLACRIKAGEIKRLELAGQNLPVWGSYLEGRLHLPAFSKVDNRISLLGWRGVLEYSDVASSSASSQKATPEVKNDHDQVASC